MKRLFGSANRRFVGASAVTALLLVPLGIFGGSALARTASAVGEYGQPGAAQYQYRVTICHHTGSKKHPWHLITISNRAVPAHLRHGDQMPPCPTTSTSGHHHGKPSSVASTSASSSGSQGHENNEGGHGNGNKDGGHHGKP